MNAKRFIPRRARSLACRLYFRIFRGVRIGGASVVSLRTNFEGGNVVGDQCTLADCNVGYGTYISDRVIARRVALGRYCSCGSNVTLSLGRHPSSGFVSTHPAFFSTAMQAGFSFVESMMFNEHTPADADGFWVRIGNDVWIGNNVVVMDGVTISDGAIVGAGAVVTKDVEAYTIVAGVPAKEIGRRFDPQTAAAIHESAWWDSSPEQLRSHAKAFASAATFLAEWPEASSCDEDTRAQ